MLVVVSRLPPGEHAAAIAANIAGLASAEVAWRLRGLAPRVLLATADAGHARGVAEALSATGFAAFVCDPAHAPTDAERVVAKTIALREGGFQVTDATAERHFCAAADVALIQRGVRGGAQRTRRERARATDDEMPGGVFFHGEERLEPQRFLLVNRADGGRDVMLYEKLLDYRFLGEAKELTSRANLAKVGDLLSALAPAAPIDDTVQRPGFLSGMPETEGDDGLDVALFLIAQSRLRAYRR